MTPATHARLRMLAAGFALAGIAVCGLVLDTALTVQGPHSELLQKSPAAPPSGAQLLRWEPTTLDVPVNHEHWTDPMPDYEWEYNRYDNRRPEDDWHYNHENREFPMHDDCNRRYPCDEDGSPIFRRPWVAGYENGAIDGEPDETEVGAWPVHDFHRGYWGHSPFRADEGVTVRAHPCGRLLHAVDAYQHASGHSLVCDGWTGDIACRYAGRPAEEPPLCRCQEDGDGRAIVNQECPLVYSREVWRRRRIEEEANVG